LGNEVFEGQLRAERGRLAHFWACCLRYEARVEGLSGRRERGLYKYVAGDGTQVGKSSNGAYRCTVKQVLHYTKTNLAI